MNATVYLFIAALAATVLGAAQPAPAHADPSAGWSLSVDVWTEGGSEDDFYDSGETVRAYVRPNHDGYVVVYGADADGVLHLLYPFDEYAPRRLRAGDLIELDGPFFEVGNGDGIVYIEALVSEYPIEPRLPMYFYQDRHAHSSYRWDYAGVRISPHGVIIGDPHLAFAELRRSLVPVGCAITARAHSTFTYRVGHRRHYPRSLCADCHIGSWYDPYADACSVFEIRVDALWSDTRYWSRCEPRYYYRKRPVAPHRYRSYKTTWSSKDGSDLLGRTFSAKSPREQRFLRDSGRADLVDRPPVRNAEKPKRNVRDGRDASPDRDRDRVTRPQRSKPDRKRDTPKATERPRRTREQKVAPKVERKRERTKADRPRASDKTDEKRRKSPPETPRKSVDKKAKVKQKGNSEKKSGSNDRRERRSR